MIVLIKFTRSLRFRITAWYLGVLTLIFVTAVYLVLRGTTAALLSGTDSFLSVAALEVSGYAVGHPGDLSGIANIANNLSDDRAGAGSGRRKHKKGVLVFNKAYVRMLDLHSGRLIVASRNMLNKQWLIDSLQRIALPPNGRTGYQFSGPTEENRIRVLTERLTIGGQSAMLQIAAPWDHNEDILEQFILSLIFGAPFVLLIAALGGWILVGRALHPISRIIAEAQALDPLCGGDHLLGVPSESDNEISDLVVTLNLMMTRLYRALDYQRQVSELQERFSADASHELRTPLTILRGQVELALIRPRTLAEYQSTLESSLEEVRRMSRIVEALTLLARGDAVSAHGGANELFRIRDTVGNVFQDYESSAHAQGVTLRKDIEGDWLMYGNPAQVDQAIRNLVDNGIKFSKLGGSVAITVSRNEGAGTIETCVKDSGIGIAAEDIPHVFERFWRADASRTSGGTGLGLAIARQIARSHGGDIIVSSSLGTGSTFTLSLPAASD